MDIPEGWTITAKGNYMCMCYRFKTDNLDEVSSHMSEFEGYCLRGVKCVGHEKFKCICGDEFFEKKGWKSTRTLLNDHICNQIEGVIQKCLNKFRAKCQKCNLQLDSPAALKLHLKTKSHLNFENKVPLHCKICDVKSDCQKEMLTHLKTKKHIKKTDSFTSNTNIVDKNVNERR
jgi:hypothetical protein